MCIQMALPAILSAGTAATGATAVAATAASTLQTIGLVTSVAAPIIGGIQAKNAANKQAKQFEVQRLQTQKLNAIEDNRTRRQFASQIRKQASQLVARGLDISSPTAVFLGQTAAEEMAFASQSVRQTGLSEAQELTHSARLARAQGSQAFLKGTFNAAGNFLSRAPDVWPELLA